MGLRAKASVATHSKCNAKLRRASSTSTSISTAASLGSSSSTSDKKLKDVKITTTKIASNVNTESKLAREATNITTQTIFHSSSTTSLVPEVAVATAASASLRPQTLNVHNPQETPTDHTQLFFGEVLNAWRAKARCNVVTADRTQELFHELSFHPSEKQIGEMLQTAKLLARKGSRQSNGLTFGEFCVLAADLKRFRASTYPVSTNFCDKGNLLSSLRNEQGDDVEDDSNAASSSKRKGNNSAACDLRFSNATTLNDSHQSTKPMQNIEDCDTGTNNKNTTNRKVSDTTTPVEVFLGGSCNPTTWRADVAIPALEELGISFYNPQVSDWTPDLIELEHRAKEKARVLFFVMDSETRASAGAIEAAHIAGQNCKQLVLVLHPYKPNQYILSEPISQQEYLDLTRNQMILKELVTRRGLPVLDNIPSALQRTKEILLGIRDPPSNIASILVVVRGAFNRVNPVNDIITVEQCQRALLYLGYAQSLVSFDNLFKIISTQRESVEVLRQQTLIYKSPESTCSSLGSMSSSSTASDAYVDPTAATVIDFEMFCVISSYLSVLQQEIHESGCISPIKGTNVPPPPVYLTNLQGDENFAVSYYASTKNISRTSSNTSVPSGTTDEFQRQCLNDLLSRSRDSGTSSPQLLEIPLKSKSATQIGKANKTHILVNFESIKATTEITTKIQTTATHAASAIHLNSAQPPTVVAHAPPASEEESDSNDSVFSSSSSINSINCSNYGDPMSFSILDFRDVYLGGSCALRSRWRRDYAMPYLKSKGVSYHMPALHESIQPSHLELLEDARSVGTQERSFIRSRRKGHSARLEEEEITVAEDTLTWSLPLPVRQNLFNPSLLDSSRVLLFVITNETRSLAPMTLAAHCIGLMYNVVISVQMLPENCVIGNERLTPAAIKDYNRGRSYLIDLAKRQGVPVFNDIKSALECTVEKVKACNSRTRCD